MNRDNYIIKDKDELLRAIQYMDVDKVEGHRLDDEDRHDVDYLYKVYWPCGEIHIYDPYNFELKGFGNKGWILEYLEFRKSKIKSWLNENK